MYKKTILENGIRVVSENIPLIPSVAIGIWVRTGSKDESIKLSGISHFLEHLMFKGTERRTAKMIAEELDYVGGHLNAFTGKEYTCYYAKVLGEHMDLAVDMLGDMVFHSAFPIEEIEKEKQVIIEEIKMYEDTPDELIHDVLSANYWPKNSLGRTVIGSTKSVSEMTRDDIVKYYQMHYDAQDIVVAAAGRVKHEDLVALIEKFSYNPPSATRKRKELGEVQHNVGCFLKKKETEQVHVCIGTQGASRYSDEYYNYQLLSSILGGSSSSRLFQKVREEAGLAYSVYSYISSYDNAGVFGIYAGTSYDNVGEVFDIIKDQLTDIKQNSVTDDELKRAKEQIKGHMLMSLEGTSARMMRIGKSELFFDRLVSIKELVSGLEKVKKDNIQEIAEKSFNPDKIAIAVIGDMTKKTLTGFYEKFNR